MDLAIKPKTLSKKLRRWRVRLARRARGRPRPGEDQPLRSELLSAEQMAHQGAVLAGAHRLGGSQQRHLLLARLDDNERVLLETSELLAQAIALRQTITPAGEWLLDNFYVIEEQIRTARRHLPKAYSSELPRLSEGVSAGLPRVYDIALETIAHGDGRIDPESLARYLAAYQTVAPLTLGELWAVPIMLRLGLIENLRRIGARIAAARIECDLAGTWADRMMRTVETDPKSLILVIADMARSNPPVGGPFVAELARRLHGQSPALALPLTWIEQRLVEVGLTLDQAVQAENQQQAADQVSVSNSIGSLRSLAVTDWRGFVESLSLTEHALRADPAGVYAAMDFATRDHYRHVVERIARRAKKPEHEVAARATGLAREAHDRDGAASRAAHVGYWLVDDGLARLESETGARPGAPRRAPWRWPRAGYFVAIAALTAALVAIPLGAAYARDVRGGLLAAAAVAALVAASQLAVALVNWLGTLAIAPRPLPRLDFRHGIPARARTLVAVPTLLTESSLDALVEALEVRHLANRDPQLAFALLTDFPDADAQTLPGDEAVLARARARIEELNRTYASGPGDVFFLLHRPRRWNAQEQAWMGEERKRGKLGDLNMLLRDGGRDRFALIVGDVERLKGVRYVITLDTDTELPRDAARTLVATLEHPLNRPRVDASCGRVVEGYGILQPRVSGTLTGAQQSRFAALFGGETGIDPYTRSVSDVYQDLFAEGSFIGKGIYDVDAFESTLGGRLPLNRILSHDLLEGCYARSGLASDAELFEDFPATYRADVSRRRRWMRGDWQIAAWLLPRVRGPRGREKNPLPALARWKIFDNLRRSLVAPALTLLLLLGWTSMPRPGAWTFAACAVLFVPPFCIGLLTLIWRADGAAPIAHVAAAARTAARDFGQALFALACLPFEAWFALDAIGRTLYRLGVTRRLLLQWTPFSEQNRRAKDGLASYARWMAVAPALAIATAAYLVVERPATVGIAAPVLLLWLVAPVAAYALSRPRPDARRALDAGELRFLRGVARRTWRFFETYVGPEDHWLPPDNWQEHPVGVLASRTSPTNIGLALLANLAAYDFGYIGLCRTIERCGATLDTLERLERHRGHFFNWYDTRALKPLLPQYISSVDSGNLVGHLLTLGSGLAALAHAPLVADSVWRGLLDTARLALEDADAESADVLRRIEHELGTFVAKPPRGANAAHAALARIASDATRAHGEWSARLAADALAIDEELLALAPWAAARELPAELAQLPVGTRWPTLAETADFAREWGTVVTRHADAAAAPEARARLVAFGRDLEAGARAAQTKLVRLARMLEQVREFTRVDYDLLYDKVRHQFAIGYNLTEHRRDASYYDLLASEARLPVFVAIAQGALPQDAWFALGRLLTRASGAPLLLSWSGSMFEYLMPLIVMPSYRGTLLDASCRAAVERQIHYGLERGVPWGISESGYNSVDAAQNYQYRAFGVPGLGLQRGLREDLVIAPYATMLALTVMPEAACANLRRLAADGYLTPLGFYEAIDFTPARIPRGQKAAVVRSYMAHHQGMGLLAIAHALLDEPMQKRFHANPALQATELLLQERVPRARALYAPQPDRVDQRVPSEAAEMPLRIFDRADTPAPAVQLLSNGRYHVMITNAGGGYSRWKDFAITRWHEDTTRDDWGAFCYLRDLGDGRVWSAAHQPTRAPTDAYEAVFTEPRVEFRRRDDELDSHWEVMVSPEDDIELRRLRLTNRTRGRKRIEVTSYAEVVLAPAIADALHPAFSKLFIETEILESRQAILCTRRPRAPDDAVPWMFHLAAVHGAEVESASCETSRMAFIGRNLELAQPAALRSEGALSNSVGSVLDPVVAIRVVVVLEPDQTATIDLVLGAADTREGAGALVAKYQDARLADRVAEMAWTHAQVVLRQINVTEADAQLYCRLASSILFASPALRADAALIARNRRGQSGLWGYAISGDLPIVLLKITQSTGIAHVRQLVQAHAYWRRKGLLVDLVIWNEERGGYRQTVHDEIMGIIASGVEASVIDRPGGIFVRLAEQISNEDRILLQAVARVILSDAAGALSEQVKRRPALEPAIAKLVPTRAREPMPAPSASAPARELVAFNGLGGFSADGREYVIVQRDDQATPLPWCNVLANPRFGTVVSDTGGAYTWCDNAHEFRLTPWSNDPVEDSSGEAFYLRDEETGDYWSPAPAPARGRGAYTTRHGFGYSVFEHVEDGIASELTVYVALDAPVKFHVLRVKNLSGRPRRLSATGYVEWVLGDLRAKTALHGVTEVDPRSGAILARNVYNPEFAEHVAFFDVDDATKTLTGDRAEFIGRNGTLRRPAALARARLSGRTGAALDPCAAIQVPFELASGGAREIIFRLGVGRGADDASRLVLLLRRSGTARAALEAIAAHWNAVLGAVQIKTPDAALDALANGWLVYQVIACRLWGRSGFYQSGGAFGFRDQLQDVMALVHAEPQLTREQIVLAASRQFLQGDVQHWWHPPAGRGVRTRCSDDFLWLPAAVCRYVEATGDKSLLDETVGFLDGRALGPNEESYYDLPLRATETASVYAHCVRALERPAYGSHGLPLMGSGDWNDGMNLVGIEGRGESVWLGFFLHHALAEFEPIARERGDGAFADRCASEAAKLREALAASGWDGAWFRRAYFDDGTPLGSSANDECRIDSIAQSWSVLSRGAEPERAREAMESLDTHLVDRERGLIRLLEPPFDRAEPNPGYIRGYVPGVRENGGQYTHSAVWAAMAFAALRDPRAWELARMILPVNHARDAAGVAVYKVEPYVVAADVYGVAPHVGRGGWTWYTGSAGWLYRLVIESLLGIARRGDALTMTPLLPAEWSGFSVAYRYRTSVYRIEISRGAPAGVFVDGARVEGADIALVDDGAEHRVSVVVSDVGRSASEASSAAL